MSNYYQVLEIARSASEDEIKKSYRRLAMKYHPDKAPGDKVAEEKFKKIAEAYDTLSDKTKKKRYDHVNDGLVHDGVKYRRGPMPGAARQARSDMDDLFSDVTWSHSGSFEDIFTNVKDIFNRKYKNKGEEIRLYVKLTLEDIATGVEYKTSYMRRSMCKICEGSGLKAQTYEKCLDCSGVGSHIRKKELNIKIPAGAKEGSETVVKNFGNWDKGCVEEGNLTIIIKEEEHKHFIRDEDDILYTKRVSFTSVVLGRTIQVPTIYGTKLKISLGKVELPGVVRIKDKGINGGDMLISIEVYIPKKSEITSDAYELIGQLDGLIEPE